jgi:hypothetical protein
MVDEQRTVESESVTSPASPTTTEAATTTDPVVSQSTAVRETSVTHTPSGAETARRVIVFLFGLVQAVIGLRIILLLADASQGNGIVRFIYDVSGFFVAPFEGVLHTNAVRAGASVLDVAALVAIVGWTILEVLIIAGIGVMRREP